VAYHFVRWTATGTKEVAEDGTNQECLRQHFQGLTFDTDPQPVPGAGIVAPVTMPDGEPLTDVNLISAEIWSATATGAGGHTPLHQFLANAGFSPTHSTDEADPHTRDAAALPDLNNVTFRGIAAMEVPTFYPYIRLSGAQLAAWAPEPTRAYALVTWNRGRARSHLDFGGFIDDTVDVLPSVQNSSAELLEYLLRKPAGSYTVQNQGVVQTLNQCAYAAMSPTGDVLVRASQIGAAPNQIPTSAANNSPERYQFHPSVFIRRNHLLATLQAVAAPRDAAITATRGPLAIWQVTRPPTHSRWVLCLDGVPRELVLAHPQGSDLRTPVEIWRSVIVPLLQASGPSFVTTYDVTYNPRTIRASGAISIGQLHQLDYARCLEVLDNSNNPILSFYAQAV